MVGGCGRGHVHGRGCAWQGACVEGGVHGRGGHAWQGVCVWQRGACMAGGMTLLSLAACMAEEMATAVDGTHPTGMHSC